MKENLSRQCLLVKEGSLGDVLYVCWLPIEFATKNQYVKIDSMAGNWRVQESFGPTKPSQYISERSRDNRLLTSIETPKDT